MNPYDRVRARPRDFLAMTGLKIAMFDALVPAFEQGWLACMETMTLKGHQRWDRAYSSYRNATFPTTEEKLFFILVYLKQAPTQVMHATMFGISQPQANRWIQRTLSALRYALAEQNVLPARTMEEFETLLMDDRTIDDDTPLFFFTTAPNDR